LFTRHNTFITIIILFMNAAFCLSAQVPQEKSVKVGIYEFKPLVYTDDNGEPQGIYVEILNKIAKSAGWNITYVSCNWPECLDKLETGKLDLVTAILTSKERKKRFIFNEVPLLSTWGQLYAKPDSGIENIRDLQNKKIAVVKDGYFYPTLKYMLKEFNVSATFITVNHYEKVFNLIEQGKADVCSAERITGLNAERYYDIEKTPVIYEHKKFLFAAPPGRHAVLDTIDSYLLRFKQDNSSIYHKALNEYLYRNRPPSEGQSFIYIPEWIRWVAIGIVVLFIASIVFIVMLRSLVKFRTAELEKSYERARWLNDLFEAMLKNATEDGMLSYTTRRMQNFFQDRRVIYTVFKNDNEMEVEYSHQPEYMPNITGKSLNLKKIPEYWKRLKGNRLIEIENCDNDKKVEPICNMLANVKTAALVHVPLVYSDSFAGVLGFESSYPRIWKKEEVQLLREIAAYLSLALVQRKTENKLRKQLNEKEVLLSEIHHRVKNNLNVVASLLSLQAEEITSIGSAKEAFKNSINRIYAMAIVHEDLYKHESFTDIYMHSYVHKVVKGIKHMYGDGVQNVEFNIECSEIVLNIQEAIPAGIIINELITNTLKHAFPNAKKGNIDIYLYNGNNNTIVLTVRDNGIGLPEGFTAGNSSTLGMQLIHILTKQLNGTLTINSEEYTDFTLRFPIED